MNNIAKEIRQVQEVTRLEASLFYAPASTNRHPLHKLEENRDWNGFWSDDTYARTCKLYFAVCM